jgi:molecular chaperone GrpE (heat shock protein)
MTVIKIPVKVQSTHTRRRDSPRRMEPDLRPESGRRPEADPKALASQDGGSPASETAIQSNDAVRAVLAETSESCPDVPASLAARHGGVGREAAEAKAAQDRLLSDVLSIADNLERALALAQEDTPIRQGVALTHRGVVQLLHRHGLERIEAHRQPFDPHWHEAIDVVSAQELGVDPGTVVHVMAPGYRRGERLFRPARVVVAQ